MKCKNIDCNNKTEKNNKYCSFNCRNIYVNKYLRDYSKNKEGFAHKKTILEEQYLLNTNRCNYCNEILSFEIKDQKFCNHSCAAKITNKLKKGKSHKLSQEGYANICFANKKIEKRNKTSESIKLYFQKKGYETINRKYVNFISEDDYKLNPAFCKICSNLLIYKNKKNKTCSKECYKQLCSNNAKNNPNCGGETNFKRYYYKNIMFDSTWEVEVAKLMDELQIKWIRNKKLILYWIDENKDKRRYHPDFYLPDYDLYIDPKNSYKQKLDEKKLIKVKENNPNINLIVGIKEEIINYINALVA